MVKILLPPSEGKAEGGNSRIPWSPDSGVFGGFLGHYREQIAEALHKGKGGSARLLGVSGKHLARAQAVNSALIGAPTLPAWQRYTGVVWDHLGLASFPTSQRAVAIRSILVVSGLAGMVRGDDPLPDYRLKVGASLSPFGNLAKWWRPDVTECLTNHSRKEVVIDLLPNDHRAAVDWTAMTNAIRVDLVARNGGRVGGHNAKAAKGLLARHLLTADSGSVERAVKSFRHPEYTARVV